MDCAGGKFLDIIFLERNPATKNRLYQVRRDQSFHLSCILGLAPRQYLIAVLSADF